jgi:tetratricopeptide (TPR) repeat protein
VLALDSRSAPARDVCLGLSGGSRLDRSFIVTTGRGRLLRGRLQKRGYKQPPLRFALLLLLASSAPAWQQPATLAESRETREAMVHYSAGIRALESEHYREAVDEFHAAVQLDGRLVIAHYGLGQAYMALKEYPEAVRAYLGCRRAFDEDARDEVDHRSGWEQRRNSEIRAIEDQLAIAESGAPGGGGLPQRPTAFSAGNPTRLRQQLDSLRTRQSRAATGALDTPPWISVALGSAYFRNGAVADAEREYLAALKVDPTVAEAHFNLAVLYLSTNRADDATRELAVVEESGMNVPEDLRADIARLRGTATGLSTPRRESFAEETLGQYSSDPPGAIAAVLSWPAARFSEFVAGVSPVSAGPALMLLTDAAERARDTGPGAGAEDQAATEIARRITDDVSSGERPREFVRRWYVAVALLAQAETRWDDALAWAERGTKTFPDSADLLSIIASTEEVLAERGDPREPESPSLAARDIEGLEDARRARERQAHLERALKAVRAAVAAAPQRADLQVRLGRIFWKLGDLASARAILEPLTEHTHSGPDAYLAQLFLGRVEEDEGRLPEAARRYEGAVALENQSQTARLALSHVELALGDGATARREASAAIRSAGHRGARDPFWLYPWGTSGQARASLATLRREVSP